MFDFRKNESEKTTMGLGNTICSLRKKNGMTQEELAGRLGVSAQAVSKWENDISCPDIYILPKLASVFCVTVDALLSGKAAEEIEAETENEEFEGNKTYKSAKKLSKINILVTNPNGKDTNVSFPIKLVDFGLKMGTSLGGLDKEQMKIIREAIENGLGGEIVNVNGENGEHVVISLE